MVSWLGLHGAGPRAQIALAHHAPQCVTLRDYQDFGLFDLWAQIARLPPIRAESVAEAVQATGANDQAVSCRDPASTKTPPNVWPQWVTLAATGTYGRMETERCHSEKSLQNNGETAFSGVPANYRRLD